jgi:asparagine synthase (glutamine-hydrolysing)
MCGFAGWIQSQSALPEGAEALQQEALQALQARGPDDGHELCWSHGWMGFRRLAILDLTDHARQPMQLGQQVLTFNGEIYNFRELRAQWLADADLASTGDTAVLAGLLQRLPVQQVLPQLRGMFALAWWDAQRLVLARDHFGIKPLYYHVSADGTLRYASERRALKKLLHGVPCGFSQAALAQYLSFGYVQAPEVMESEIRCLLPGQLLVWENGQVQLERWFTPRWPGAAAWCQDPQEQLARVRAGVLESVRAHLIADVPVGVFLSGGLDSTLMAVLMRELGQQRIQAFSLGYDEGAGVPDESQAAQQTAAFLGCEFQAERLNADTVESLLDGYIQSLDQPTGDALNTWLVSRLAARGVKVVLSGLGADEWWAGYNYHRLVSLTMHSPLRWAGAAVRGVEQLLPAALRGHPLWKAGFYSLGGHGATALACQAQARTVFSLAEVAGLTGQTVATVNAQTLSAPVRQALQQDLLQHPPGHWLQELLLAETQTYLANMLLRDNDVMSMAHSLELRVPLVDRAVFELAGQIPPEAKLNALGGKRILREAFKDLLPAHIYEDKKKKTFTLPLMKWMRLPRWRERILDTLNARECRQRGWLDAKTVEKTCAAYFSSSLETKRGWALSQRVWMLYVLEAWARQNGG